MFKPVVVLSSVLLALGLTATLNKALQESGKVRYSRILGIVLLPQTQPRFSERKG